MDKYRVKAAENQNIKSETRNRKRTDLIVDCHGEQFIIEIKIWYGNAYHMRGEQQLSGYLDYYHLKKDICSALISIKRKWYQRNCFGR